MRYNFFEDDVIWFPEHRIIIIVDNNLETILDCADHIVQLQGKHALVEFHNLLNDKLFSPSLYDKILENFNTIDPFHWTKGDQNYRRWFFYNSNYNITIILCSSYGYTHFYVSKRYFLARKIELDETRAVNITAKFSGSF